MHVVLLRRCTSCPLPLLLASNQGFGFHWLDGGYQGAQETLTNLFHNISGFQSEFCGEGYEASYQKCLPHVGCNLPLDAVDSFAFEQ
jgi:hypothetical protein